MGGGLSSAGLSPAQGYSFLPVDQEMCLPWVRAAGPGIQEGGRAGRLRSVCCFRAWVGGRDQGRRFARRQAREASALLVIL